MNQRKAQVEASQGMDSFKTLHPGDVPGYRGKNEHKQWRFGVKKGVRRMRRRVGKEIISKELEIVVDTDTGESTMRSRDFCFWLKGFFELDPAGTNLELDADQIKCIKTHLDLVFQHEIDPSMGTPEHQAELNNIHQSVPSSNLLIRC